MYPQAILFDLDNTLVDRHRSIAAYAVEFRSRFSVQPDTIETPAIAQVLVEADGGGYREWSELKMGIVTNGVSASRNATIDTLATRPYMNAIVISEEAVGVEARSRDL